MQESVEEAGDGGRTRLVELREQLSPEAGIMATDRLTAPAKPFSAPTVMLESPDPPEMKTIAVGAAVRVKS